MSLVVIGKQRSYQETDTVIHVGQTTITLSRRQAEQLLRDLDRELDRQTTMMQLRAREATQ